jgi:hypothetical protein
VEDILRTYQDQVSNMFVTEQIRSALTLDPFQHLKENIPQKFLERIISSIRVISHHSVKTMEGYVRTEAIITLTQQDFNTNTNNSSNSNSSLSTSTNIPNAGIVKSNDIFNKKRPRTNPLGNEGGINLHFTYVRTSMTSTHPCTVSYTIDLRNTAVSNGTHEVRSKPLLWVYVYAAGVVPSSHDTSHAININNNDDDQWSDIDDEDESAQDVDTQSINASSKSNKVSNEIETTEPNIKMNHENIENGSNHDQNKDRYEAGMDPDVVALFISYLESTNRVSFDKRDNNTSYSEITMFFLLMTFPFYEHEWDLVGFLLQAVFGNDSVDGSKEE